MFEPYLMGQYESVIQRTGQFQQPAQTQPRVDPAAIPSVSNVPLNGVYQDDFSRASQSSSGAAYQGTRNNSAGV